MRQLSVQVGRENAERHGQAREGPFARQLGQGAVEHLQSVDLVLVPVTRRKYAPHTSSDRRWSSWGRSWLGVHAHGDAAAGEGAKADAGHAVDLVAGVLEDLERADMGIALGAARDKRKPQLGAGQMTPEPTLIALARWQRDRAKGRQAASRGALMPPDQDPRGGDMRQLDACPEPPRLGFGQKVDRAIRFPQEKVQIGLLVIDRDDHGAMRRQHPVEDGQHVCEARRCNRTAAT